VYGARVTTDTVVIITVLFLAIFGTNCYYSLRNVDGKHYELGYMEWNVRLKKPVTNEPKYVQDKLFTICLSSADGTTKHCFHFDVVTSVNNQFKNSPVIQSLKKTFSRVIQTVGKQRKRSTPRQHFNPSKLSTVTCQRRNWLNNN